MLFSFARVSAVLERVSDFYENGRRRPVRRPGSNSAFRIWTFPRTCAPSLWPAHGSGSGRAARVPVVTGKVLHQNNENPPGRLGSRRFLERVTLIAVLI